MTTTSSWTCPEGHEAIRDFCPWDGSKRPVDRASKTWPMPGVEQVAPNAWQRSETKGGQEGSPPSAAWAVRNSSHQPGSWGAPSAWQAPSPPQRRLPVRAIVAIVVAAVLVLGGGIAVVAWAISSSSGGGFNNVSTLENSIQSTYQDRLSSNGVTVTNVSCVGSSNRQYNCVLELSNGLSVSHHVTVSSDGTHWVSDNTP